MNEDNKREENRKRNDEIFHLKSLIELSIRRVIPSTKNPYNPRMVVETTLLTDKELDKVKKKLLKLINVK